MPADTHMSLRKTSSIALVIMCANSIFAQEIKVDKTLHLSDYMTLIGIGADHVFDGLTTYKGVNLRPVPCKEKILPSFIKTSPGRLAMYEAGTWALQVWGTKYGIEHGYGKWVRPLNYVTLAFESGNVFYNLHSIQVQEENHPIHILIKD